MMIRAPIRDFGKQLQYGIAILSSVAATELQSTVTTAPFLPNTAGGGGPATPWPWQVT